MRILNVLSALTSLSQWTLVCETDLNHFVAMLFTVGTTISFITADNLQENILASQGY